MNQATGRCSVEGSKYWFNCNPDGPYHWFKENWIDKASEKKLLYLHFTMDDNLSLSEKIKERYRSMYSGVFYKRYILGLWCMAEGVIYDMFDAARHVVKNPENLVKANYYVSAIMVHRMQLYSFCGVKIPKESGSASGNITILEEKKPARRPIQNMLTT